MKAMAKDKKVNIAVTQTQLIEWKTGGKAKSKCFFRYAKGKQFNIQLSQYNEIRNMWLWK